MKFFLSYLILSAILATIMRDISVGLLLFVVFVLLHLLIYMIWTMTPAGAKALEESFEEIPLFHLCGIKEFTENALLKARSDSEIVYLHTCDKEPKYVSLKIKDIDKIEFLSETEIIEKDKSVIARAIAGGLLFGAVGAVVGGISGITPSKEQKITNLVKIYMKDSSEILFAPFMNSENIAKAFVKRVKEHLSR